ncbi:hypothetical protein PISMIDRAFT_680074 [Pisolithus microcarpus 441]|uniref:Unplaced genomic scaffold scaffold_54, whole genome shotgun sequence n=1 Tax=Pisolithus microcarpus 441 TaxID=765257 RepID=A0A0C9ZRY1_9AGAM|nr:hypothetical protein BKA83DRAFT_680074 [Pisolithus microcarpus]KIK22503.1 hypothetical protein PISMIDRAFT_680074 [Pisolithus microcarpus 441]
MSAKQFVLQFRGKKNDALYGLHGPQSSALKLLAWISAHDKSHIALFKIRISIPPGGAVSRLPHMLQGSTVSQRMARSSIIVDPLATSSGGFRSELTLSPALAGTMLVSSLLSCSGVWILWTIPIKLDDPQDTAIQCIYVSRRLAHWKWISIPG